MRAYTAIFNEQYWTIHSMKIFNNSSRISRNPTFFLSLTKLCKKWCTEQVQDKCFWKKKWINISQNKGKSAWECCESTVCSLFEMLCKSEARYCAQAERYLFINYLWEDNCFHLNLWLKFLSSPLLELSGAKSILFLFVISLP